MVVPDRYCLAAGKREGKYSLETSYESEASLRHAEKLAEIRRYMAGLDAQETESIGDRADEIVARGMTCLRQLQYRTAGVQDLAMAACPKPKHLRKTRGTSKTAVSRAVGRLVRHCDGLAVPSDVEAAVALPQRRGWHVVAPHAAQAGRVIAELSRPSRAYPGSSPTLISAVRGPLRPPRWRRRGRLPKRPDRRSPLYWR